MRDELEALAGRHTKGRDTLADYEKVMWRYRYRYRDLTMSAYQLRRAIVTGETVNNPETPFEEAPSLDQLRVRFESELAAWDETADAYDAGEYPSSSEKLPVQIVDDLDDMFEFSDLTAEVRMADLADEFEELVEAAESVKKSERERIVREADEEIARIKAESRAEDLLDPEKLILRRIGGETVVISQDGGRDAVSAASGVDPAAAGYVRLPHAGACGFCTVLGSRGFENAYRSEKSASWSGWDMRTQWRLEHGGPKYKKLRKQRKSPAYVPDKFHPNCQCDVVEVYTQEQFDNDSTFDPVRAALKAYRGRSTIGKNVFEQTDRVVRPGRYKGV